MESPRSALLSPGEVFHGRYEVRRALAVGGMAIVYEVLNTVTRRLAALKVMIPQFAAEPEMRERFTREAAVAASIESDAIVTVLDAGIDGPTGSPFLVMELLSGDDLEKTLHEHGPLPPGEVVGLLAQVAPAIDALHQAHVIHRDLKPGNLFLTERGVLKIIDFGIAKLEVTSLPAPTTRNLGTPVYMSPEQVRGDGDIGPRSDLHSLGQIAYTLLVGAPYWGEEGARGGRVLFDEVLDGASEPATERARRSGVELPGAFDAWFWRATAVEPEDRFESAQSMVEALAKALGVPIPAPTQRALPVQRRPSPRSARRRIGLVAVALAAVALLWPALRGRHEATGGRTAATQPEERSSPPTPARAASAESPEASARPEAAPRETPKAAPSASAKPTSAPARVKPSAKPPVHDSNPFGTSVL